MPNDQQVEVYRQHRTAQDKYVYFLLATAGAAIALAMNQTQGAGLRWSQLPLACAVVLCALSFFFGCRHLAYVESTLFMNAELLKVQAGEHPKAGGHPDLIAMASEVIREELASKSSWASRHSRWQFRCLVLGAICYLGWHVIEMWLRS